MVRAVRLCVTSAFGCMLAVAVPMQASARHETVLYAFQGGSDGADSRAALLEDTSGNLYGTTYEGGGTGCDEGVGCGTVFELPAGGTETVLYGFAGPPGDGAEPWSALISDSSGNLYGSTSAGGSGDGGTVFKIAAGGTQSTLHSFTGSSHGREPLAGLIEDASGNFFGTTFRGGAHSAGTVFRLAADGTEKVVHSFAGGSDGRAPQANLIVDTSGNLYGTTSRGGTHHHGTVFMLTPDGTETLLYSFAARKNGLDPVAGLIMDQAGNLYGTTKLGGRYGYGTVFEITAAGAFTVLHSFGLGSQHDGQWPWGALVADSAGNLYGTTEGGGAYNNGTVFEIASGGTETVLYSFAGGNDGAHPYASLISDGSGNLYGTTQAGGGSTGCNDGCGTIFEISK